MSVLLRIGRKVAILRDGKWVSADSRLEAQLERETESWFVDNGGPPISHFDPEHATASEMARRLGGRIAIRIPASSRSRVLFDAKRQLEFKF
ncbi:MAG: hypothetical protein WD696_15025 [Bryobacteraceae bacterium]